MNEVKIRKQWVVALWTCVCVFALLACLGLSVSSESNIREEIYGCLLGMLLRFGLLYCFAFRGKGTIYIGLCLLGAPFWILQELLTTTWSNSLEVTALVLTNVPWVWFLLKSYDLYKLNKYLKEQDSYEKV